MTAFEFDEGMEFIVHDDAVSAAYDRFVEKAYDLWYEEQERKAEWWFFSELPEYEGYAACD